MHPTYGFVVPARITARLSCNSADVGQLSPVRQGLGDGEFNTVSGHEFGPVCTVSSCHSEKSTGAELIGLVVGKRTQQLPRGRQRNPSAFPHLADGTQRSLAHFG